MAIIRQYTDELITGREVRAILRVSKTEFFRNYRYAAGFPQPLDLPGFPRWRRSDILHFIRTAKQRRPEQEATP